MLFNLGLAPTWTLIPIVLLQGSFFPSFLRGRHQMSQGIPGLVLTSTDVLELHG